MSPTVATILGMAAGGAYFFEGERGITADENCSYLSPWTTDALAWIGGAILVYKGHEHNDPLVSFIGSTVASIHVAQFAAHKVLTRAEAPLLPEE